MGETTIEWTDKTWNPVTGCTKVSPGCKHCYAERVFPRAYSKTRIPTGNGGVRNREFTDILVHADRLDQPLRWRKPQRIFVNSMSDLFHDDVPFEFIDKTFAIMGLAVQHTFQILTKRPQRMLEYMSGNYLERALKQAPDLAGPDASFVDWHDPWWKRTYNNVCLGVSVENQQYADERIPLLLKTPAAVRFVSYEPALGPVRFFTPWLTEKLPRLDWVIVGGESGPGARPFQIQWARDVVAQCKTAGVACFVKQLGAEPTGFDGPVGDGLGLVDRKGGDMAEWPEDLRVREFPHAVPV